MTTMKRIALAALLVLSVVAFAQTRSDVFDSSKSHVYEIILRPLADGGCSVTWGATLKSNDGGAELNTVTPSMDLQSTLGRGYCTGLASKGMNQVRKAMRLGDDGGIP